MTVLARRTRALALALVALAALLAIPATASAIPRDEVLARGKVWVDKYVPYSQKGYADLEGNLVGSSTQGWRRDCSGFTSMCLDLRYADGTPKSLDSASLGTVLERITKDQLQPGDVILRPRTLKIDGKQVAYGHALIFVAWADEAHTQYWSYEESGGSGGAVTRLVPYPFYGEPGFLPYRYENIQDDFSDCMDKVRGDDRYETAAAAAHVSFPTTVSVPALVLASGENWPDALGGSALAGVAGGPLLLTDDARLPAATKTEIRRLTPKKVYVLGGTASVSESVTAEITKLGATVVRLGGKDRYETAALAAREAVTVGRANGRTIDTAFVATGMDFPDALSASPISARTGRPVLLTAPGTLSPATAKALKDLKLTKATIVGGERSVTPSVAAELASAGVVPTRIAAGDRYATALKVAELGESLGLKWDGVGFASGATFADALAGGAAQGRVGSLMMLTPGEPLHTGVAAAVTQNATNVGRPRVYGGLVTITQKTRQQIADIVRAGL